MQVLVQYLETTGNLAQEAAWYILAEQQNVEKHTVSTSTAPYFEVESALNV